MGTSTKDFRISGSVWLRYKILLCRPYNSRPHVCVCVHSLFVFLFPIIRLYKRSPFSPLCDYALLFFLLINSSSYYSFPVFIVATLVEHFLYLLTLSFFWRGEKF